VYLLCFSSIIHNQHFYLSSCNFISRRDNIEAFKNIAGPLGSLKVSGWFLGPAKYNF